MQMILLFGPMVSVKSGGIGGMLSSYGFLRVSSSFSTWHLGKVELGFLKDDNRGRL